MKISRVISIGIIAVVTVSIVIFMFVQFRSYILHWVVNIYMWILVHTVFRGLAD
jgi:hypothetical protein